MTTGLAGKNPQSKSWYFALHLFALNAFAIVQPLLEQLSRHPEFFVSRSSSPADILLLVSVLLFIPVGFLWVVERLVGIAGPRVLRATHLIFIAGFVMLISLAPINRLDLMPDAGVFLAAFLGLQPA